MKVEIQAGAKFETATKDEVRDELAAMRTSWMAELAKGDRFVRFSAVATIAAGTVTVGDRDENRVGPREGFVWSINRLAISNYDTTTDSLSLYTGDASDSTLIIPDISTSVLLGHNEIVLYPGDRLILNGAHTGAGRVWLTGQAREVPISLAWRL